MNTSMLVVFSHGKESGPHGRKLHALAEVAREHGALTVSVDYRESPLGTKHDANRPGEAERRVGQLLAEPLPKVARTVFVGSSMGGYVSTVAALKKPVDGLFLLAPAFFLQGYEAQSFEGTLPPTEIVHGWSDEVVPWQNSARFAERHRCTLHLINGDHRLDEALPRIERLFRLFLSSGAPHGEGHENLVKFAPTVLDRE